ncbi:GDSL esterase/lipase [Termitomyces sp. T112]|nr:GDSL esterase/lipase [Termitomyces sp. T112]
MKVSLLTLSALLLITSTAAAQGVQPKQIKNLVTFGDSYTDIVNVGDGGVAWPVYAAGYANVTLFPFAKSGATCSNNITYRPFPSVFESQLPAYFAEIGNGSLEVDPEETIYTLWIGTNDLGINSLVTGSNNASIVDVANCMINWVKVLYNSGARNFVFQNMIPLQDTILYSANSYPNRFWQPERNTTAWSVFMTELVLSGNALTKLLLQNLAPTLPGSHIALFDSHALFADIYAHPALYLNGTAPLNVTGCINPCVFDTNGTVISCSTVSNQAERDSYLWWDELHPSEQADRVVAKEVATMIGGGASDWATWLS